VTGLTDEETLLVATVRAFVDREVKPAVREVKHASAWVAGVAAQLVARGGL